MSSHDINRRNFLLKSGVAAAAVGGLASCAELGQLQSPASSENAGDVQNWDMTTDVVIVGSGAAGMCAAIEAARGGANVIVLEKYDTIGGSSAISGGVCYLGGGTALQTAAGFTDSTENMYNYMVNAGGAHPHTNKIQRYCEDSVAHFNWLVEAGVPFNNQFKETRGFPEGSDDSLYFSGNENHPSFAKFAEAAPRGHVPSVNGNAGWKLMEVLSNQAKAAGVTILTQYSAERLVQEKDGAVIGLVSEHNGGTQRIKARWGVLLASGGFIRNSAMLKKYAPELADLSTPHAAPGDLGIGIKMGLAAGGEAIRMNQALISLPISPPERVMKGILVNSAGQRFIAEDMYDSNLGWDAAIKQGGTVYLIGDATTDYEGEGASVYEKVATGDSMYSLERFLGISIGSLQMTVQLYNQNAYWGKDTQYGKAKPYVAPIDTPPFHAYRLDTSKDFCPSLTFGGLNTKVGGQVVNVWGDVIPGLYAAGRCSSGIPSGPYLGSGASLGDASFFGRLAGQALVAANSTKKRYWNEPEKEEPEENFEESSVEDSVENNTTTDNADADTNTNEATSSSTGSSTNTSDEPPIAETFPVEPSAAKPSAAPAPTPAPAAPTPPKPAPVTTEDSDDDWLSIQKAGDGT